VPGLGQMTAQLAALQPRKLAGCEVVERLHSWKMDAAAAEGKPE
jgi:hypothetical protein